MLHRKLDQTTTEVNCSRDKERWEQGNEVMGKEVIKYICTRRPLPYVTRFRGRCDVTGRQTWTPTLRLRRRGRAISPRHGDASTVARGSRAAGVWPLLLLLLRHAYTIGSGLLRLSTVALI